MNEKQLLTFIATFVAVAETGSFKRAAERISRSQPAVTSQINQLEDILGTALLVRTTRSVRLTAAGSELLERGKKILNDTQRLVQDFQVQSATSIGKVVISVSPTIAVSLIPLVLRSMELEHPRISAFLREDLGPEMLAAVETGQVDFGLGPYARVPERLVFEPILDQEFLLILPNNHPIALRGSARAEDLRGLELICPSPGSTARAVIDDLAETISLRIVPKYETMQYPTIFALVAAGLGATVMPTVDPKLLDSSSLAAVPFKGRKVYRTIGKISRRGEPLTSVAKAFLRTFQFIAAQERQRLRIDA